MDTLPMRRAILRACCGLGAVFASESRVTVAASVDTMTVSRAILGTDGAHLAELSRESRIARALILDTASVIVTHSQALIRTVHGERCKSAFNLECFSVTSLIRMASTKTNQSLSPDHHDSHSTASGGSISFVGSLLPREGINIEDKAVVIAGLETGYNLATSINKDARAKRHGSGIRTRHRHNTAHLVVLVRFPGSCFRVKQMEVIVSYNSIKTAKQQDLRSCSGHHSVRTRARPRPILRNGSPCFLCQIIHMEVVKHRHVGRSSEDVKLALDGSSTVI